MAFMAVRDFKCTLCHQQFTLLAGDLTPGPFFCDQCIREVWLLEDDMLKKHVVNCLEDGENIPVDKIIMNIKQFKEGGIGVEDVIEQRERGRRGILG